MSKAREERKGSESTYGERRLDVIAIAIKEKLDGPPNNPHISNLLSSNLQPQRIKITPEITERIMFSAAICLGLQYSR